MKSTPQKWIIYSFLAQLGRCRCVGYNYLIEYVSVDALSRATAINKSGNIFHSSAPECVYGQRFIKFIHIDSDVLQSANHRRRSVDELRSESDALLSPSADIVRILGFAIVSINQLI